MIVIYVKFLILCFNYFICIPAIYVLKNYNYIHKSINSQTSLEIYYTYNLISNKPHIEKSIINQKFYL